MVAKWQASTDRSFILYIDTSGNVNVAALQSNNAGASAVKSGFTNSVWHHVGFEFNEGINKYRCWLNGVAGTDSAATTFGMKDSTVNVRIGSSADDGTKRYWDGAICDVAAWSTGALGAATWGAMAKGVPAHMFHRDLMLSYVPLWGAGTNEPDLSGIGNHFTVNGTLAQRNHGPVGPYLSAAA